MLGIVKFVNPKNGFFAVEVEDGDFTVIESLGGYEINVGDTIIGRLDVHGGESLTNQTKSETISAFIQGLHCAAATAQAMVFR